MSGRPTRTNRWEAALLALPVGFNLWVLRAEVRVVENLNDGSVHAAMVRVAGRAFRQLRVPLDVWFPFITTGTPNFHQYQSLPHIVSGLPGALIGGDAMYAWSLYLLLALWPISVYLGMRLMGWGGTHALAAAFVSSFVASVPGYGAEWFSYLYAGLGVWTQLWGVWLLPIALGLTWRAVDRGAAPVRAAVVLGLTIVANLITGYFAVLAVGVWTIVRPGRRDIVPRSIRAIGVGAAGLATTAWLVVPALSDQKWLAGGHFTLGALRHSFGARKVFGWFLSGRLTDQAFMPSGLRFPVITLLMYVGIIWCVVNFRKHARARGLLGLLVVALVMFAGRPTFGFLIDWLPGSGALLLHRYVLAVQLVAVCLAGVGAGWLTALALDALRGRVTPAVAVAAIVVVGVLVLVPAMRERANLAAISARLIDAQFAAERQDGGARKALIRRALREGNGRIYAGRPDNWGRAYKVGAVSGYNAVVNADADVVGYVFRVGSILYDAELLFDESELPQLDAFGVRYLLLPASRRPPVSAELIERRGAHTLWRIRGSGYVAVVDTAGAMSIARQRDAWAEQRRFLDSAELERGVYAPVSYLGRAAASPTLTGGASPATSPGTVRPLNFDRAKGVFAASVNASRTVAVVLKSSFHGRWRVTVDGRVADKYMVMPGYPAVTVGAGQHRIEFRYMPVGDYPFLLGLAAAALVVLFLVSRRMRWAESGSGAIPSAE